MRCNITEKYSEHIFVSQEGNRRRFPYPPITLTCTRRGGEFLRITGGAGGGRLHEIYRNRWVGARAEVVVPEAGPDYEVEHT